MSKLLFLPILALIFCLVSCSSSVFLYQKNNSSISKKLREIEKETSGRIGLSAINMSNNQSIEYRAKELFPLCSTSKLIAVSAILKKSEKYPNLMRQKIFYGKKEVDKSGYAPITKKHIKSGMTISELSMAAIEHSDNAAMNLLVKFLGGPKALNSYAKSLGDEQFRMVRLEPELNSAAPNDLRDTTSPLAMRKTLQKVALEEGLKPKQQEQLQNWLKNNKTGALRIRSGVPRGWLVGDKTGTGNYGTTNDIGIIWPSKCNAPIVVAIYFTQNKKDALARDEVISKVTSMMIEEFLKTSQCLEG